VANIVEYRWRRSSRCDHGQCVEVALLPTRVVMRDSKDPGGSVLNFDRETWTGFVGSLRDGEFDRVSFEG
jgi:uncharacterized protein DUF397